MRSMSVRLLDLAVDHAEEVQRDGQLDHEAVDQHEVADRTIVRDHAAAAIAINAVRPAAMAMAAAGVVSHKLSVGDLVLINTFMLQL